MLTNLFFFLIAGATLSLLLWSGIELFQNQEDPLGDRLEELHATPQEQREGGARGEEEQDIGQHARLIP